MTDHSATSGAHRGVDDTRLDANWRAIEIELDAPRPSRIERSLRRVGVPSHMTRLALATPALRRSWYLAAFGVVVLGLATADAMSPRQSLIGWLTLAPLVPVLGVMLAYGTDADGEHEMHLATPMLGTRLLAIRAFVVLIGAAAIMTPVAVLNPVMRSHAAAWLVPGLAVIGLTLALMTVTTPRRSAGAAAAAWIGVVWVSQIGTDPLVAFALPAQCIAAGVAVVTLAVVRQRRAHFDRLRLGT